MTDDDTLPDSPDDWTWTREMFETWRAMHGYDPPSWLEWAIRSTLAPEPGVDATRTPEV